MRAGPADAGVGAVDVELPAVVVVVEPTAVVVETPEAALDGAVVVVTEPLDVGSLYAGAVDVWDVALPPPK